jgi:hypothetical protein
MTSSAPLNIATTPTVLGLASLGIAAAPKPTNAWWHHNGYGLVRSGVYFRAERRRAGARRNTRPLLRPR